MLKELEHHFSSRGWYDSTHTFMSIRLEGGFEAFSGHASETWEYRWVITIHENLEMQIPALVVKGKVYDETLDQLADRTLKLLIAAEEKLKTEPQLSIEKEFVDWNKFSMDDLANYLENKYLLQSSGEALAIHKLVNFYRKNKNK